jgi:hypothetical protein
MMAITFESLRKTAESQSTLCNPTYLPAHLALRSRSNLRGVLRVPKDDHHVDGNPPKETISPSEIRILPA